jgi:hypothetical protein
MCAELNKYAEALVYHIDMAVPANIAVELQSK